MIDILVCNHNTTYYTNNCIRTFIHENSNLDYNIYILDDSDREKFALDKDFPDNNIKILDNTNRQLFSYNEILLKYIKFPRYNNACYYHAMNIQWFLDNIAYKDLLLFDSDIIFKKSIDFLDFNYITVGFLEQEHFIKYKNENILRKPRIYPFLQYFNVDLLKKYNIKYFDPNRLIQEDKNMLKYDTGASFYEDIVKKDIPIKLIDKSIYSYIHHYGNKSWKI